MSNEKWREETTLELPVPTAGELRETAQNVSTHLTQIHELLTNAGGECIVLDLCADAVGVKKMNVPQREVEGVIAFVGRWRTAVDAFAADAEAAETGDAEVAA